MTDAERLIAQIERAARHLHPLVISGDVAAARAAHDALNALTAARCTAELLLNTESKGA